MVIYGAGLAGLLTAHILRRHKPVVHEAQGSLPNNHEALLRFRTDAVSRATGIPFREVDVWKTIRYRGRSIGRPDIQLNNLYSYKVTGEYHTRSIGNMSDCRRYIAPNNLIIQLADGLDIRYNSPLTMKAVKSNGHGVLHGTNIPIISTIPMPTLMHFADFQAPVFKFKSITSIWADVVLPAMNIYQTIYYPDPDVPYYRASITGNRIIIEFSETGINDVDANRALEQVLPDFGLDRKKLQLKDVNVKSQKYGKILPIDEAERRRFILAATDDYRIYSIGRFATWRQILMDDVVQDAVLVEGWINDRNAYQRRLRQIG